ncbi:hypothetical protein Tco_0586397 [Tanacetum coccineum]
MENANPPPTRPILPAALHARFNQELQELQKISAFVDSRLKSIKRLLNHFTDQPNKTSINDSESDNGSRETPLYENAGTLHRERIISSSDRDDLAFECMIGFRKFTAYLDPFLPMNIISRKAYNTIMVERLEETGKNLVAIVRDVYVFVRSFTYVIDFFILEDIGEFIMSDMAKVIFDEKKLGSSLEVSLDDYRRTI